MLKESNDEIAARLIAASIEDKERAYYSDIHYASIEGFQQGFEEGLRQAREARFQQNFEKGFKQGKEEVTLEIVKAFYKNCISLEIISKSTGLSIDEIKKIIK